MTMVLLAKYLPFTEPIYIFTVLITAIFLSPFLFRPLKIPDVATFIIVGIAIGPFGFHILNRDSSIELLGTVGLLYIMFIIGLELDPEKLKISRRHSIIFGLFTFTIPFIIGLAISRFVLKLDNVSSTLVSIMFSSHTLVAYPIVRKLGVNRDISVLTAIGGTIITDTLVLIILSVITRDSGGQPAIAYVLRTFLLFGVYLLVIFYGLPRISRWFFANIKRDRPVHFLFLLLMVSISSVLAKIIGFEPIIGAFVAGMALSRSVPRNSMLMHHVDFVGNILFIPVFLIGIGMLIDVRILFTHTYLWYISLLLISSALAGKWLAAYFTQKSMGFSVVQRNLLFGLSSSRAAATIAVILIGFERNLVSENILNATVLLILVSCLAASYITDRQGKKMVLTGTAEREDNRLNVILVPISNPSSMAALVSLAKDFLDQMAGESIYVLSIVHDDLSTKENLVQIRKAMEHNILEFNNLNDSVKVITRVDLNVSSGILRAAKEYMVTDIIFGWGGRTTPSKKIFGSIFDQLFTGTQTLYACNINESLRSVDKVVVILPENLEHELSFNSIIKRILRLPIRPGGVIEFHTSPQLVPGSLKSGLQRKNKIKIRHLAYTQLSDLEIGTSPNILNIVFTLRRQSVSYSSSYNSYIQKRIAIAEHGNFILIVPGFE